MQNIASAFKFRKLLVVPQFEKLRECLSLSSDKEGEFFATGVYSSVHDRSKKRRLTQDHGKLRRSRAVPAAFSKASRRCA
jgi:hypothetical protein